MSDLFFCDRSNSNHRDEDQCWAVDHRVPGSQLDFIIIFIELFCIFRLSLKNPLFY